MAQLAGVLSLVAFWLFIPIWHHRVVAPQPPGLQRALRTVPLLVGGILVTLPFMLHGPKFVFLVTWFLLGLSLAKVLVFSANRGPLCFQRPALTQALVIVLPVIPTDEPVMRKAFSDQLVTPSRLPAHVIAAVLKAGTLFMVCRVLPYQDSLPVVVFDVLSVLVTCLSIDTIHTLSSLLVASTCRMDLVAAYNHPWLSASVAELWRSRWNVMTGLVFRWLVFDPVMEGSWMKHPSSTAALPSGPNMASRNIAPDGSKELNQHDVSGTNGPHSMPPTCHTAEATANDHGSAALLKRRDDVSSLKRWAKHASRGAETMRSTDVQKQQSSALKRHSAVFVTFAVSGLLHELAYCMSNYQYRLAHGRTIDVGNTKSDRFVFSLWSGSDLDAGQGVPDTCSLSAAGMGGAEICDSHDGTFSYQSTNMNVAGHQFEQHHRWFSPGGAWTLFFCIQPVLMFLESVLWLPLIDRCTAGRPRLRHTLRVIATLSVMLLSIHYLWMPVCHEDLQGCFVPC